jgi:hypothetical protein
MAAEQQHGPAPGEEAEEGQEQAAFGNTLALTATAQQGLQGFEARKDSVDKMVGLASQSDVTHPSLSRAAPRYPVIMGVAR